MRESRQHTNFSSRLVSMACLPAAASVSLLAHALQARRRVVHRSIISVSVLLPLPVTPAPADLYGLLTTFARRL